MSQGRSGLGWKRTWVFPAAGSAAALGLTLTPGLPFAAWSWPAEGPFGVFTWVAWTVSTALALTLLLAGAVQRWRDRLGTSTTGAGLGRILRAAAAFTLLAASAYFAAARVELIERRPLAALGLAVAAMVAIRTLILALNQSVESETGESSDSVESDPPARRLDARPVAADDDDEDDDLEFTPPRWVRVISTIAAALLVVVVLLNLAMRWLGPGLGIVITTQEPTPIFWAESAFYEYDAARREGKPRASFLNPPKPQTDDSARRTVLPAGVKLAIKDWVDRGAQVRIEFDPEAKLEGEWGYIRLDDLTR